MCDEDEVFTASMREHHREMRAEGWMIGAEKTDETAIAWTASSISEHTNEIRSLLAT